ncbi:MAG: endonuclease/exonuclease/phosphatase family protein [Treponemataceae bacterium]
MSKTTINCSKIILFFILIMFYSCNHQTEIKTVNRKETSSTQKIKIANWNLQTFFDTTVDGSEYSGFTAKDKNWTEEKYIQRIKRLCSLIKTFDADIIVMEEIEKQDIIYDIINNYELQGRWDKSYNYACFAGEQSQAFGVAILSRYPISEYTVHKIDIRSEKEKQPKMRPVLNAKIQVKNKLLSLYGCHWKSKVKENDEGKKWRNFQQEQLANLLQNDKDLVIVCGDFNQDLSEFQIQADETETKKYVIFNCNSQNIKLNSCWLETDSSAELDTGYGSYYYKNEWSKIDHVFYDKNIFLLNFCTVKNAENTTEEGIPYRYSVWSGKGVSDHLPITCTFQF